MHLTGSRRNSVREATSDRASAWMVGNPYTILDPRIVPLNTARMHHEFRFDCEARGTLYE